MLSDLEKDKILNSFKLWFKETLACNHIKNTTKLVNPKEFNINPFLVGYLAKYLNTDCSPRSIAKALIYPRVLGSSITTSFGTNLQKSITEILSAFGSTTSGIDIEYVDQLDNRKKYCQLKAGPNTINKDDVETIDRHFKAIKNLGRTNSLNLQQNDLVIGILYGDEDEISTHYKNLRDNYEVFAGKELWKRITGDECFYNDLQKAIAEIASELSAQKELNETIDLLAKNKYIIELSKSLES